MKSDFDEKIDILTQESKKQEDDRLENGNKLTLAEEKIKKLLPKTEKLLIENEQLRKECSEKYMPLTSHVELIEQKEELIKRLKDELHQKDNQINDKTQEKFEMANISSQFLSQESLKEKIEVIKNELTLQTQTNLELVDIQKQKEDKITGLKSDIAKLQRIRSEYFEDKESLSKRLEVVSEENTRIRKLLTGMRQEKLDLEVQNDNLNQNLEDSMKNNEYLKLEREDYLAKMGSESGKLVETSSSLSKMELDYKQLQEGYSQLKDDFGKKSELLKEWIIKFDNLKSINSKLSEEEIKESQNLRKKNEDFKSRNLVLEDEIGQLESENKNWIELNENQRLEILNLQARETTTKANIRSYISKLISLQKSIGGVRNIQSSIKEDFIRQVSDLKNTNLSNSSVLNSAIKKLLSRIQELQTCQESIQTERSEMSKTCIGLNQQKSSLKQELDLLRTHNKDLKDSLDKTRREMSTVSSSFSNYKNSTQDILKDLNESFNELQVQSKQDLDRVYKECDLEILKNKDKCLREFERVKQTLVNAVKLKEETVIGLVDSIELKVTNKKRKIKK